MTLVYGGMNLKHLTDKQLLIDTKFIANEDKKVTTKLLHHIKEVDQRKLYSELGYPSLFRYVVQELGYSEGAAGRRINAARLLKDIPEIELKIVNGDLTLSHISKAADKFKQEDIKDKNFKREILKTIQNTSIRNCEKTLAEIIVPEKLPLIPENKYFFINVSVTQATYEKFEELRDLLAHKRFNRDELLDYIFNIAIDRIKIKKFHLTNVKETTSKNPRYITAAVKKAVYLRDKVCQKCGTKYGLQYDHRKPYALGGKSTKENIRLLCRNCNQRARISSNLHFP